MLEREEDVCCGTSKANSAIVHAGFDAAHGSLMAKFNLRGSELMEPLSRELDFPYRRTGSLVVCMSESDRPRLNALYENGVKNGVPGLEIVERDRLRELEPNISPDAVAGPLGADRRDRLSLRPDHRLGGKRRRQRRPLPVQHEGHRHPPRKWPLGH